MQEQPAAVLGAYVKGMFDAAASRGILTRAAVATMVNALHNLYGHDKFEIEVPQAIPADIKMDAGLVKDNAPDIMKKFESVKKSQPG